MAERSVVVRIRAEISDFRNQMAQAATAARETGRAAEQSGTQATTSMGRLTQAATKNEQAWSKSGTALLGFGGILVAGVGLAISKFAEFDKAMSEVQASTHETAGNMDLLRTAAIDAGADTAFSAKEAAQGIDELAKAGVSTQEILNGGLAGALSLAAAGSLGVGDAAEIAATALTQFGLHGKDIPHVADLLAAGAGKAQGSVEDMGQALKQSGLVASQFGLSVDDTTGTLAAFASAGLLGSDSGTSFKTMLLKLASPSKQAAGMMSELGIAAYDSGGKFVGITSLAGQLHDKLGNLTQAQRDSTLATIFGTDAIRGANVLYQQGAEGIQKWIDKVNDSGYAAITAAAKQDNLSGDIEKVGGSLDSVFIKSGSGANDVLRGLAQSANNLIDMFGGLDPKVLQTGLSLAAVVGGAALAGGAFLTLAPKVISTVTAFRGLTATGSTIPGTLGKIGKAAGIAAVALVGLQVAASFASDEKTKSVDDYGNAILKLSNAGSKASSTDLDSVFQGYTKFANMDTSNVKNTAEAIQRLSHQDFGDSVQQFFRPLGALVGAPKAEIGQLEDRFKGLGDTLGDMTKNGGGEAAARTFSTLAASFKAAGGNAQDALDYMPGYKSALEAQAKAVGVNVEGQDLLDLAMGKIPPKMAAATSAQQINAQTAQVQAQMSEEAAKALEEIGINASGAVTDLSKLYDAMTKAGLITVSAREAENTYQEALAGLDKQINTINATQTAHNQVLNQTGTDFDSTSAAGRSAGGVFDDLAQKAIGTTKAMADNGATQGELSGKLHSTYDDLKNAAIGFGMSADQADELARKTLGIPPKVDIDTAIQNFADTMAKAAAIKGAVEQIPNQKTIFFTTDASGFYDPSAGTNGRTTKSNPNGGAGSGFLNNGSPRGYWSGGLVDGLAFGGVVPGIPPMDQRRDNVLAMVDGKPLGLQSGEFVVNGAATRANLPLLQAINAGSDVGYSAPAKSMAGGGGANMSQSYGYGRSIPATAASSAAPDVRVYIGNEQIDARIELVSAGVADSKINAVTRSVGGMRR